MSQSKVPSPSARHRNFFLCVLILLPALTWARARPAPIPPPIIGGFADARGQLDFFAVKGGRVEAVDLKTGKSRWISDKGHWPLWTQFGRLLVGRPDPDQKYGLLLSLLKPADASVLIEFPSLVFPRRADFAASMVSDQRGVRTSGVGARLEFWAWAPSPRRGPARKFQDLRIRINWRLDPNAGRGSRLRLGMPIMTGVFYLDSSDGSVEAGGPSSHVSRNPPEPRLLKTWRAKKSEIYWSWSDHGGAWTDRPRPFEIGGGVMGYLAYEHEARRLSLHRWRRLEPLTPVQIDQGSQYRPIVCSAGRYLVLSIQKRKKEDYRLYDLMRIGKTGALANLRRLPRGFREPLGVLGRRLFYIVEKSKVLRSGDARVSRRLVAMDWKKGRKIWDLDLASRFQPAPTPRQK